LILFYYRFAVLKKKVVVFIFFSFLYVIDFSLLLFLFYFEFSFLYVTDFSLLLFLFYFEFEFVLFYYILF